MSAPQYQGPTRSLRLTGPDGTVYEPPKETFYMAYRGSIAHGMFVPSTDPNSIDDIDLMGFTFGEPENYFGLREWGSRGTKETRQGVYDVVLYEIRKAVSLLLQGNPNILSMLWVRSSDVLVSEPAAPQLVFNRSLFVGKHVYNAFAGYAHAQLEKMETRDPAELREYLAVTAELKYRGAHPNHKGESVPYPESVGRLETKNVINWTTEKLLQRLKHFQHKGENLGYMGDKRKHLVLEHGYDSKNAAHLIRLLRMCIEFLQTGELIVFRPDAAELLDIKRGRWPLADVKTLSADLFEAAKVARDASTLPDEPDRQGAERLLVQLVRERLAAGECS
jgi:predicted nucleotidyltransferase